MKNSIKILIVIAIAVSFGFTFYPIDGYKRTGIKRLYQIQKFQEDSVPYNRIPAGAYKKTEDIKLNLISVKDSLNNILVEDKDFARRVNSLFPRGAYSAAVMDMSNPENLKYAEYRENVGYQPGSVGKIAVLNAVFYQLAKICPDSWEDRVMYLKDIKVSSRYWGTGDHHTIPVYDIDEDKLVKRRVVASDVFSLYEWLDHMTSVSATIDIRDAIKKTNSNCDRF